jgi:hypothetical protein
MTNQSVPDRFSQWRKWCQYVFTEFSQCEVDEGQRMTDKQTIHANVMVVTLQCTYQTYRECIADIVDSYDGYCPWFHSNDNPKTMGREYDYKIIFTRNVSDIEYFDIIDGQLVDKRGY